MSFSLDFPYLIEQRYQKMVSEVNEYSELIYDYLVAEGTDPFGWLSDHYIKKTIRKNYK